jgi:hypothetical protein
VPLKYAKSKFTYKASKLYPEVCKSPPEKYHPPPPGLTQYIAQLVFTKWRLLGAAGTGGWDTPENIFQADTLYAKGRLNLWNYTKTLNTYLNTTYIPVEAVNLGLRAHFWYKKAYVSACLPTFYRVSLYDGTNPFGDQKTDSSLWLLTDQQIYFGSWTANWGLTLTPEMLNASTFGIGVQIFASTKSAAPPIAWIDSMHLFVSYYL